MDVEVEVDIEVRTSASNMKTRLETIYHQRHIIVSTNQLDAHEDSAKMMLTLISLVSGNASFALAEHMFGFCVRMHKSCPSH